MTDKQIDKLFNGLVFNTLSEEELKELQINRLVIPQLDVELNLKNDIYKAVNFIGNQKLKLLLDKIHHEVIQTNPGNKNTKNKGSKKLRKVALLLSFVFLSMLSLFTYKMIAPTTQPNNQELYAEYYEPYKSSLTTRGENTEILTNFSNAYYQKNFDEALVIIEPILELSSNEIKFISGICAMESNAFNKANKLFSFVINSNDFYYGDHAKWYKALNLIQNNNDSEAVLLLNDLAKDSNADHHLEATKLLKVLGEK